MKISIWDQYSTIHMKFRGIRDITRQISLDFISPKEEQEQFLRASPHRSFSPPKSRSWLLHKYKPKRSGPYMRRVAAYENNKKINIVQ
jgi:hypothetical protein